MSSSRAKGLMRDNKKDEGDVTFEKLVLDCLFMAVALLSSLLEFA